MGKFVSELVQGFSGAISGALGLLGIGEDPVVNNEPYNKNLLTNETAPTSYLGVVYGERRKAGVRIGTFVKGDSNQFLYAVYALSHGPVKAISNPRMEDVSFSSYNSMGLSNLEGVIVSPQNAIFDWSFGVGENNQDATTDRLIQELGSDWDSVNGKLGGVAFAIVKLTLDRDLMNSLGNMTFDVTGRTLFDPRTGTTDWSNNPSLCALDYQMNPIYGKGLAYPEAFDVTSYIDAANYFEEAGEAVVSQIVGNCELSEAGKLLGYMTTDKATFDQLAVGETYTVSGFLDPLDTFTGMVGKDFQSAASQNTSPNQETLGNTSAVYRLHFIALTSLLSPDIDAFPTTALTFSQGGVVSGVSSKYSCNGNLDTSKEVYENLKTLISCFNGYVTFFNGLSTIIPDRPQLVSGSFNSNNITSDIQVGIPDKSSQLNEVTGTWFDPEFGYDKMTATVKSAVYLKRDRNIRQSKEVNLPFSNNPAMVDRILTIELNKSRHNYPIVFKTMWSGLSVLAGNVIDVTDEELGWIARELMIVRMGIPDVYNDVELTCVPYDANDYIEGTINPRKIKDYINYAAKGNIEPPTSVTVSRVYDVDNQSVKVEWDPAPGVPYDGFDLEVYEVSRVGQVVDYTKVSEYLKIFTTSYILSDVFTDQKEYEFRVYAWDQGGSRSVYYTFAAYFHGRILPPTGITVKVEGPWSASAIPTYPTERLNQAKLNHKWYLTRYISGSEPVFSESDLVVTAPMFNWSGLIPNKSYRLWCRAVTDYDTSIVFPTGNGVSFSTPDTVSEDLGSANVGGDLDLVDIITIKKELSTMPLQWDSIVSDITSIAKEALGDKESITGIIKVDTKIDTETLARVTSITSLTAVVDNNSANVTTVSNAVATKAEQSALLSLTARVQTEEAGTVSTSLILTATNNAVDGLQAQAYLGTDVNGRVSGLFVDSDASRTDIEFLGDKTSFVHPDTLEKMIRFDLNTREFIFDGKIIAINGSIGGWNIDSNYIYSGSYPVTTDRFASVGEGITLYAGASGAAIRSENFRIDKDGSAYFSGELSAATGTFSGALSAATGTFSGTVFSQNSTTIPIHGIATAGGSAFAGGAFYNNNAGSNKYGVLGQNNSGVGVYGIGSSAGVLALNIGTGEAVKATGGDYAVYGAARAGGIADFYAGSTGSYLPFTGSHEGLLDKNHPIINVGDIVVDKGVFNISDISNAITFIEVSSVKNQRSAIGVMVTRRPINPEIPPLAVGDDNVIIAITHDVATFNSLGEGAMNVCGEGGDIEIGDLITTSNMVGKGMKQLDQDNLKPYTVAQSRQNVSFSSLDEVVQIAVIYKCG